SRAPLANNGGSAQTHVLVTGSPAIDAGSSSLLPADTFDLDGDTNTAEPLPVDQRGISFSRVIGTALDIGAVEGAPNHAPTCSIGPAQNVNAETPPQSVDNWVTNCLANDPNQTVSFT